MIPTIPGERVERVGHGHNFLYPYTRRDLALNLHALHERSQKRDSSTQQTGQIMSRTETQEPTTTRAEAATQWVRDYLTEHGGRAPAMDVYAAGHKAGYVPSTLKAGRKASYDVIAVKEGKCWVWQLVNEEELETVAAAHSTSLDALEERRRDHTHPQRIVVTHWPCRGLTRVTTETLDPTSHDGFSRRTSWVRSEPTTCKIQSPDMEGEAK